MKRKGVRVLGLNPPVLAVRIIKVFIILVSQLIRSDERPKLDLFIPPEPLNRSLEAPLLLPPNPRESAQGNVTGQSFISRAISAALPGPPPAFPSAGPHSLRADLLSARRRPRSPARTCSALT